MPWIYAGDIIASSELLHLPGGALVAIETQKGQAVGTGYYNARSQIACRVLTLEREIIDTAFFTRRLNKALELRQRLVDVPYYRLVHSEADGLPGLLIDRFGDRVVVQVGTAGMEALQPLWLEALHTVLKPQAIVLRNDTSARRLEGLAGEIHILPSSLGGEGHGGGAFAPTESAVTPTLTLSPQGGGDYMVDVHENGCIYLADLLRGQKTGWFYDQRDNRRLMAEHSAGKTVLDVYSHSGGFGLLAAKYGAAQVTLADSSKLALDLALQAAARNGVEKQIRVLQGDAFARMEQLHREDRIFDIVLADPPAFVKNRKDIAAGLKGYEKVARLAAALVTPGGLLFVASCSHHAGRSAFNKAVCDGITKAGRQGEILKQTGAAPDHPRHPLLLQNEYLKGILLRIA